MCRSWLPWARPTSCLFSSMDPHSAPSSRFLCGNSLGPRTGYLVSLVGSQAVSEA
ncbi:rCG60404 [Rattus norvegicus]|uniref:RCG60404 n=1 Tax=Rattus norvegicus TaxID=10116 RepID=A6KK57_RAT|nr:rCG60404 [Rattus norvegicus]